MNLFDNFGVEHIEQPYQTFIDPQTGTVNLDYFTQFDQRLVVINFSSEHWNNLENVVYKKLDAAGINFLLLTYDHSKHQRHPRIFYYPYWYYMTVWFWNREYPRNTAVDNNKSYLLGCLNAGARTHRIANFLKLQNKPYWNQSCVSFHNEFRTRPDEFKLLNAEIDQWAKIQHLYPERPIERPSSRKDMTAPQLIDSYLHMVTEVTALPTIFLSEKIWKPVAAGVPFVVWGDLGTMNLLKTHGVDIYDDIIDHNYYDTEQDARVRLNKLHKVVDDLINQGVDKIYSKLLNRIVDNQTKYFCGEFANEYQSMIFDAIKKYN